MLSSATIQEFSESYFLENMVKKSTFFKNPEKPPCINLIITNKLGMLGNSKVYEADLSYFNKLVISIMKLSNKKDRHAW